MLPAPGSTVPGRGAWTKGGHATGLPHYRWLWYWYNDGFDPDKSFSHRAVHLGIVGIQQMLLLAGVTVKITGVYDKQTAAAVKAFQAKVGLKADGIYGRETAWDLSHLLIGHIANYRDVPPEIIWGFARLESVLDPAAVGPSGFDCGMTQINLQPEAHGGQFTPEQAFNPFSNISYTCGRFKQAYDVRYGPSKGPDLQLDCAIAQHNSPKAADEWWEVGWTGPDEKINIYVQGIKRLAATY